MPSTYTGSGIELIGDGEQSGSWGNTTNNNLEIINSLVSEAGALLNGRCGTVLEHASNSVGRFTIRLDRGGEIKSIAAVNLSQGQPILPCRHAT